MTETTAYREVPSTMLADVLGREQVMDIGIRPLWTPVRHTRETGYAVFVFAGKRFRASEQFGPCDFEEIGADDVAYWIDTRGSGSGRPREASGAVTCRHLVEPNE